MSRLEEVNPFPWVDEEPQHPRRRDSKGSKIIKTELDHDLGVRYDVIHNFFGDEVVTIAPSIQKNWLCGYVTFPDGCPLPPEVNSGVEGEANVHGGVTYSTENKDGSYTYGFDCAHLDDGASARSNNPEWVLSEAKRLYKEIIRIKKESEQNGS